MSGGLVEARFLAGERGVSRALGAHVLAACFGAGGEAACFALAEGGLVLAGGAPEAWRERAPPSGAVLCLAPDVRQGGVVVGGDDGALHRLAPEGDWSELGRFGRRWVEQGRDPWRRRRRADRLRRRARDAPAVRRWRAPAQLRASLDRHRDRLRHARQAARRLALQRRVALVHRLEGRRAATAGVEGQPYRRRDPPCRRRGGDGDAGERAARLAARRRAAHADERLPGQAAHRRLHPERAVARLLGRGRGGAVAVLRRRPDGQGADRTRAGRGDLHPGGLPPEAGDGRRRFRGRAGGAGRHRHRPGAAGAGGGAWRGERAGLERERRVAGRGDGGGIRAGGGPGRRVAERCEPRPSSRASLPSAAPSG